MSAAPRTDPTRRVRLNLLGRARLSPSLFMKFVPLCLLFLTGCTTTNITKLVRELAKDPAAVAIQITSVYGTVTFVRVADTNRQISIGPITVR